MVVVTISLSDHVFTIHSIYRPPADPITAAPRCTGVRRPSALSSPSIGNERSACSKPLRSPRRPAIFRMLDQLPVGMVPLLAALEPLCSRRSTSCSSGKPSVRDSTRSGISVCMPAGCGFPVMDPRPAARTGPPAWSSAFSSMRKLDQVVQPLDVRVDDLEQNGSSLAFLFNLDQARPGRKGRPVHIAQLFLAQVASIQQVLRKRMLPGPAFEGKAIGDEDLGDEAISYRG